MSDSSEYFLEYFLEYLLEYLIKQMNNLGKYFLE